MNMALAQCRPKSLRTAVHGSILALLLVCPAIRALGENETQYDMPTLYYQLDKRIQTPSIPWAKPYYKGKRIRILVLAPRWQQRNTIELEQRMNAACDAVFLYQPGRMWLDGRDWGLEKARGNLKAGFLKRLDAALQKKYDVMIMSAVDTNRLPADFIARILAKINDGCGLVYLHGRPPMKNRDFITWYGEAYSDKFLETLQQHPVYKCDEKTRASLDNRSAATVMADNDSSDVIDEMLSNRDRLPLFKNVICGGFPFKYLKAYHIPESKPVTALNQLLQLYQYGKGHVLLLQNWNESVHYGETGKCSFLGGNLVAEGSNDLTYEYYLGFLIKCVLWSAGLSPGIQFVDFPEQVDGNKLVFDLSAVDGPPPSGLMAVMSIRSASETLQKPDRPLIQNGVQRTALALTPVYSKEQAVKLDDKKEISFTIPELPYADYYLDVRLMSAGKTVNWAIAKLSVKDHRLILKMSCDPKVIDLKNKGSQSVQVACSFQAAIRQSGRMNLTLYDNFNRILAEKDVDLKQGASDFNETLVIDNVRDIQSSLLKLRAELSQRQRPVDVRMLYLTTINRPFPFFCLSAWAGPGRSRNSRHRFRVFANLGFDIVRGAGRLDLLKIADMRFDGGFLTLNRWTSGSVRYQYGDPVWRRKIQQDIGDAVSTAKTYDYYSFIMGGDEPDFPMSFAGPFYTFRTYLENVYGTVAELNKAWGTDYTCFEAVKQDQFEDRNFRERQVNATKTGRFAPIIDYRMWQYWMVADLFRFAWQTVHRDAPGNKLAVTTLMWNHLGRGYFFPEILQYVDYFSPYLSCAGRGDLTASEAGRSFMRKDAVFGMLAGSYYSAMIGPAEYFEVFPHANLIGGSRNVYWYNFSESGETGLSPSMTPYEQTASAIRELKWIKDGVAELILKAKCKQPDIAVLYSQESYVFAYYGYGGSKVQWRQNKVLKDFKGLGYSTRFVTDDQIKHDALAPFKVLYLPVSQCISRAAAEKIKAFVRSGGVLIADVRPGIADEHGNVYEHSPLADVFGVQWRKPLDKIVAVHLLPDAAQNPESATFSLKGVFNGVTFADQGSRYDQIGWWDRNLTLTSGKAALFLDRFVSKRHLADLETSNRQLKTQLEAATTPQRKKLQTQLEQQEADLSNLKTILHNQTRVPIMVDHPYGKGHAALLGMSMSDGKPDAYLLGAILKSYGIRPEVAVVKGKSGLQPDCFIPGFESERFDDGDNRYYGFVSMEPEGAQRYRIRTDFDKPGYTYDMRNGTFLGKKTFVEDSFPGFWVKWYAVLPYKVKALNVTASRPIPGKPIVGRIKLLTETGEKPGRHIVNVKVLQNGVEVPYLTRDLELHDGQCEFRIPTAVNDRTGLWRLMARDVASGIHTELEIAKLKPRD